jgi:predicted branched-subunit amino acid permease
LGITARNAGITPLQGFLMSLLCNASAGEYVGISLIAVGATFLEVALATLVTNLRYILMSCALSQRMSPHLLLHHRILMGYDINDEIFGITIARPGYLDPWYTYGALVTSVPLWATGTALGIVAGNLLPLRLVSAFSVALYGMFLAVIIPPARKDKVVLLLVIFGFAASFVGGLIPYFSQIAEGTRTIILTIVISALAALIFPKKEEEEVVAE